MTIPQKFFEPLNDDDAPALRSVLEPAGLKESKRYAEALFWQACENNKIDCATYLAKNGKHLDIDVGQADNFKKCCESGHLEIVKLLVDSGADPLEDRGVSLQWAAKGGSLDVVSYLYEDHAYVNLDNDAKALNLAVRNGHLDVVKYLHEAGGDIFNDGGQPLTLSVMHGHLPILDYLLASGCDINHKDTLLPLAMRHGQKHVFDYLIASGVDIYAGNNNAIRFAATDGHLWALDRIFKHDPDYFETLLTRDEAFQEIDSVQAYLYEMLMSRNAESRPKRRGPQV